MLNYISGMLAGALIALICADIFSADIAIATWIYVLSTIVVFIISVAVKVYLFVTDYKAMAETGITAGKFCLNWVKNRKNKVVA